MKTLTLLTLIFSLTSCLPEFNKSGLHFSTPSVARQEPVETAPAASFDELMKTQCMECHAKTFEDPERLDRWMSATSPEESRIFKSVESARMPKGKPALPTTSLELIRNRVSDYQVKEKILIPKCIQCHEKTLNDAERMAKWIVPGKPEESKLYLSVKSGRMPKRSDPLTEFELKVLENYILNLR